MMSQEIIVITGGGSGLGAALAKKFSQAGAVIVLADLSEENMRQTALSLAGPCHSYKVDISDSDDVQTVFTRIYQDLGRIDRLINCAGLGVYDLTEKIPPAMVHKMIDVNLKGTIFCTQAVLPTMKKENRGYLINVISMSGVRALAEESVYCASKFGADGFTKAVSLELAGTDVKVSNFYMGAMATAMWKDSPQEVRDSFIQPEDMAELIFDNTKVRKNLTVDEVRIRNIRK